MRRMMLLMGLALTFCALDARAETGDVTNGTVIALSRAGLSDTAIITVVERPRTDFDVTPEALIRLREVGLSNAVIEAIIAAERRANPPAAASGADNTLQPAPVDSVACNFEAAFWESISHSVEIADYDAYLLQYPYGHFTSLAVARLETLRAKQASVAPVPEASSKWPTPPEPSAVGAVASQQPLDTRELLRNDQFLKAVSGFARVKYRFEIERFTRMRIVVRSNNRVVIETSYLWANDDTSSRVGRGTVTLHRIASSYQVVGFESYYPTPGQLLRFDHGASGL